MRHPGRSVTRHERQRDEPPSSRRQRGGDAGERQSGAEIVQRPRLRLGVLLEIVGPEVAIGIDGTVFCGESDRGGKLYFYIPGPGNFEGGINPTNPVTERQRLDTPALIQEDL